MMLYINPIFVSVYLFVCAFACLFGSLFAVFLCCRFEYFCVSHLFHVRITARLSSILQRGIPLEFNDFLSRFSYWLFTTMFLLSFSNKNNFIKTVRLILQTYCSRHWANKNNLKLSEFLYISSMPQSSWLVHQSLNQYPLVTCLVCTRQYLQPTSQDCQWFPPSWAFQH